MAVEQERTALGIELGSTRVKAVLVGADLETLATGGYEWRSRLEDGHWTYDLDDVWLSIQSAFADLRAAFASKYDEQLTTVGSLGISAMMHGYLAFDAADKLLVPFRTWQDTTTGQAAAELSERFQFNIPMRWSIAHLHQAILDQEPHVAELAAMTTLAGYVHWKLTGERVLGVGDASGMFPIDSTTCDYDERLLDSYRELVGARNFAWDIGAVLPAVRRAGENAGTLSSEGALLLDPTGTFRSGAVVAPPEGDAGTGMVATNSVRPRTANISAGTSIFAMVVLEHPLETMHEELDLVTTPDGAPTVMVHCNNGAADVQDWVMLFGEAAKALGAEFDTDVLFRTLYERSLEGEPDAAGLVAFNYRAGEPITRTDEGRPLFVRMPESSLRLADFMRAQLYGVFATLRIGFDILHGEGVGIQQLFAHGGLFRTRGVAQRYLSAALDVPVTVGTSAGEGGAWGMALLAAFMLRDDDDLAAWLDAEVFAAQEQESLEADADDKEGFTNFMRRYRTALELQRVAIEAMPR